MATTVTSLIVLSYCFIASQSMIIQYNFEAGMMPFSYQTFSAVPMYSEKNTPSRSSPGNGQSYIDFDLIIERDWTDTDAFIELIVIPDININDIGIKQNGNLHLCCNVDLFGKYGCNEDHIGELIIPKTIKGSYREKISFESSSSSKTFKTRAPVSVTAIHVFALSSCDSNLEISNDKETSITFKGEARWMNPYGYLPGDQYRYLPFSGWMCLIYSILLIVWIIVNKIYYKRLLISVALQIGINLVLLLSLVNMTIRYGYWMDLNNNGLVNNESNIFAFIVLGIRDILATLLFVALCNGCGVVKTFKSVSKIRYIIVSLCIIIYWTVIITQSVSMKWSTTSTIKSRETWLICLISGGVIFICLIFISLESMIKQLTQKQDTKFIAFYKGLRILCMTASLFFLILSLYSAIFALTKLYFDQWNNVWIIHCWPEFLFLFLMIGIITLLLRGITVSRNDYSEYISLQVFSLLRSDKILTFRKRKFKERKLWIIHYWPAFLFLFLMIGIITLLLRGIRVSSDDYSEFDDKMNKYHLSLSDDFEGIKA